MAQLRTSRLIETSVTRRLDRRVLSFIRERELLSPGARVLAGLSGGPDSTALLMILTRLRNELALDITVAHFDHMLRTRDEAREDLQYARWLAGALGLPLVTGRGDVRGRASRQGESVEDAARRMRYAFLGRAAKRAAAAIVSVGHTENDRAESVLMHLLRGSGLDGLATMRPLSRWPFGKGPEIARPLLALTREDTERYCRQAGVSPRRDPSNDLDLATRNRLRRELLPALRSFNPRVEAALARLADAAAADSDYIENAVVEAWQRTARTTRDEVCFRRDDLVDLDPAILARLVRRSVAHLAGSTDGLEAVHVQDVLATLGKQRSAVSLPGGLRAAIGRSGLRISRGGPPVQMGIPPTSLPVPGAVRAGLWTVTAKMSQPPLEARTTPGETWLDPRAIAGGLWVRSRRPGDRMRPLGLGGSKKLQDVLVDAGVPQEERDGLPLVGDDRGILWAVGGAIDERGALPKTARKAVRLRAKRGSRRKE